MEDDIIHLTISNPVPDYTPPKERASNKMAQENIKLRIAAFYGKKGKLSVEKVDSNYELTLHFPYIQAKQ